MGYIDALTMLLKKCRMKSRAAAVAVTKAKQGGHLAIDESVVPMWKERGARVALILASQLVEMKVQNFIIIIQIVPKYENFRFFSTGIDGSYETLRPTCLPT
jgi:hypothetical protein